MNVMFKSHGTLALIACAAIAFAAPSRAQSTINTGVPATGAPFQSLPIRSNFQAAATDINGILAGHAATSTDNCPSVPSVFEDCLVIGSSPYLWYKWTGGTGGWGQVGSINPSTGAFAIALSSGNVTKVDPITTSFAAGNVSIGLGINSSLAVAGSPGVLGINLAHSNTFSAAQTINLNAAALTALTGTVLNLGQANAAVARVQLNSFGSIAAFTGAAYGGTGASPTAVTSGTELVGFNAFAYNGATLAGPISSFRSYAAENIASGHQGSKACIGTTPIGSATLADSLCQQNDGGITIGTPSGGSQGAGTLNLAGSLYSNGTAPTGTGAYVRAASASLATPTLASPALTGTVTGNNTIPYSILAQGAGLSVLGVTGSATANIAAITGAASQFFGVNSAGTALAFQTMGGDATLSGPTLTIAANAITYAKFQQVAASSLVGNATGSLANATGITLGSTLSFSGSALQTGAISGDVTSSANSFATTLATVNSNVGSFGSSTAIPIFTINGKGLITAASTAAVIAPAGTLTGTTLASNVVTSSLTSVGTLAGLTVTGSFTATGLVTNADLVNASTTVNGQTCTLGSTCTISASAGSVTIGTTTITSGATNSILYQNGASPAGTIGEITTANNGVLVTSAAGVPSISSTLPTAVQSNIVQLGTQAAALAMGGQNITGAGTITGTQITSTISTGTAPLVVASTTNVPNLNASSLNGATFASPGSIGSGTAAAGAFTTLSASSTVSGTGFSTYLASPPAIGGTAAAAGTFTTLKATGNVQFTGISGGTIAFAVCTDSAGNLVPNSSANCYAGGSASAAGSPTQVQWNSGGSLAANAGFTFDGTSVLSLGVSGTSVGGLKLFNATSGFVQLIPQTGALGSSQISVPAVTDTMVTLAATQTLTNKSIAASQITGQLGGANGGTGVNNGSSTITLGGNLTTAGAFATTLTATAATNSTLPAGTHTLASLDGTGQTQSGGVRLTPNSISTGSFTLDCGLNPAQFVTNNGAYTITAPSNDGTCLLLVTNGASAGATTFSGFTVGSATGDPLDTVSGRKFTISFWRINGTSSYVIKALQ